MKVKSNMLSRFINLKVVAFIMAMALVATYFSISGTTDVVKVNGNETGNAPFEQNGHTYVPLNEVSQRMGDTVTTNGNKVSIRKGNGDLIVVMENQARAIWQGKIVPLKTKQINDVTVPVNAKAIMKNGQLYVPVEFLSAPKGMEYPVKVVDEGGKTVIYVGTIPAPVQTEQPKNPDPTPAQPTQPNEPVQTPTQPAQPVKPSPQPTQPVKPSPQPTQPAQPAPSQPSVGGQTYPDGWVAPVLKSAWSPNMEQNYATLKNELGFINDGTTYAIEGQADAISVIDDGPTSPNEVIMVFYGWVDPNLAQSYRVPIVTKELFKLYFGADANRVWDYFNTNNIPPQFTANGRTVTASYSEATGAISLHVGKK